MGYKLVALDMDGTLLDSKKTIRQETLDDIESADEVGINVVLCTGRGKMEIEEYRNRLKSIRYAILLSGALLYDLKTDRVMFQKQFYEPYVERIISTAEKYDGMIHFMTAEKSVVRKDQVCQMAEYNMGIYQEMFVRVTTPAEDVRKMLGEVGLPLKMLIYFRTPQDREKGFAELKELSLEFVFAEVTSLEMTPKGVDKGNGLKRLTEMLDIPLEDTVAIGDGANDIQMLKTAGYSVAMKNANDDIKAICDTVTEDNDRNGVGKAISALLVCE